MRSVGIEIGGTFTDLVSIGPEGVRVAKVPSTPAAPDEAAFHALHAAGIAPDAMEEFVHGSTVATNAVLERRGARLALLVTEGFRDVLLLARQDKQQLFNLRYRKPVALVAREDALEVPERLLADGTPARAFDAEGFAPRLAAFLAQAKPGAVAICLLNAYANPVHEQALAALVRQLAPGLPVTASHEVSQEFREYERASTTALAAYVQPVLDAYLSRMETRLAEGGFTGDFSVMQSNGGRVPAAAMRRNAASALLSGPAAGVMGAVRQAGRSGVRDIITLDVGGTSADVALIIGGQPQFGLGEKIGDLPLYIPSVAVSSIGDGGGSIARVDGFGVLKVGPESAGSSPGPACYGRGGTHATITDAFAVCGFLGQHDLAYGAFRPDVALARAVIGELAARMGLGVEQTAEAIIRIAISGMFAEVNKMVARYGIDPRDFALLTFGGAGPMLGCFLARELGMRRVLIPARPGVVSALGGLVADVKNDFIRTLFITAEPGDAAALRAAGQGLSVQALHWLREEQGFTDEAAPAWFADMRYRGQSYEIEVPLDPAWIEAAAMADIAEAFHRAHEGIYDFCDRAAPAQIVNLRLVMSGPSPKPVLRRLPGAAPGAPPVARHLRCFFDGGWHEVPLYQREALGFGHRLAGPCVVAQEDTTSCIPPGFAAEVDAQGNIILEAV